MNRYVALLRGINVGGNNIIKMLDLKASFEKMGFENVMTFIQSGNVIFDSKEQQDKLEEKIEKVLSQTFSYTSKVMIRSQAEIQKVLEQAPPDWKSRTDIRCYIAFLKSPLTSEQAIKEITLAEGIDSIKKGPGVIYMTSVLEKLTKSKMNRLASLKIYQNMTIRNYNTTKKIAQMMDK